MSIRQLLTDFLEYLEIERNRSQKTIENYHHYLNRFLDWSKAESPSDINMDLVRKFRIQLNRFQDERGKELKKTTQNYHIIALRSFVKYLSKRDVPVLSAEKIEVGKNPASMVGVLNSSELERLLESASGEDIKTLRDKAILELFFSA